LSRRSSRELVVTAGVALSAFGVLAFFAGCQDGLDARQPVTCADPKLFAEAVSPYIERRCGTLDCHGSAQRPLRLYGELGLRHPLEENVSGGVETTSLERDANFESVCGVEPERMTEAVGDLGASADKLLIVAKPRDVRHHKGGKVIDEGSDADRCLTGWVGALSAEDRAEVRARCKAALAALE
jgi:hypothetical protein